MRSERTDRDRPSAHVGIDHERPIGALSTLAIARAALARNAVDGERHAAVADRCP